MSFILCPGGITWRLFPTPKAFSVSDWLELATNRLAAPARKRIGLEIEAHYAEAVRAHLEEGMSEWDAQAAALAELGDAFAAARRFRKQHLTEREAQSIESMLKNARSSDFRLALIAYIAFALFAYLTRNDSYLVHYRHHFVSQAVLFLVWVALPTASFILARRKSANLNLSLLILIQCFSGFYFGAGLISVMEGQHSANMWLNTCAWGWPVSIFLTRFDIWRKLRKVGCLCDELPPRDAAIS